MDLFKNFLYEAAGCRPNWTSVSIIEEQEARVRARVGDDQVLCALSAGSTPRWPPCSSTGPSGTS
jgi:GMP synthase (glutamine-hydrolysing)